MPSIEVRVRKNGNRFVRVIVGYDGKKPIRVSKTFPPGVDIEPWIAQVTKPTIWTIYQEYEQHRYDLKLNTKKRQRYAFKFLKNGNQDIASFTTARLQKILDEAPLQISTKRILRSFISVLFRFATERGYIETNPAVALRLPRRERARVNKVLDEHQLELLKHSLDLSSEVDVAILTLMVTGLRCGELFALEPRHLQGNRLRVEGTVVPLIQPEHGKRYTNSPKTPSSLRTVSLPDYLVSLLNQKRGDYLFTCSYQRVKRRLSQLCEELGLPAIKPHGLRHSHATFLLSKNIPLPAIAARLGHSNPSITLSTYSHLVDSMGEEILKVL